MRIAQLSSATGVSVASLKFYLREGLVPPGVQTAPNQAEYDAQHVQRVRLIRVLVDTGGMSIAAVREVVAALEAPHKPVAAVVGVVHHALTQSTTSVDDPALRAARRDVNRWLKELGWTVTRAAPSRRTLADALVSLRRLGRDMPAATFFRYAAAADELAEWELRQTGARPHASREELVESVVVGTVVYESVLLALRRLAQEHQFAQQSVTGKL